MKRLLACLLLAPFVGSAADTVIERLSHVEYFAFGGVGFAGKTSPGELDYREILARPAAVADFEGLFESGNLQAKCYALTALSRLNHDEFVRLSQPLRSSSAKVHTMVGCIAKVRPVSTIVREMESAQVEKK